MNSHHGILPAPSAGHGMVGRDARGWNYTTVLDVVALVAFAALYWLNRNRPRFGGGAGYAKDPVCGMQVQVAHAPASTMFDGRSYHFCSDHCAHRFAAAPERYAGGGTADEAHDSGESAVDPVCGMTVAASGAQRTTRHEGVGCVFCSTGRRDAFRAHPGGYVGRVVDRHGRC